MEYKHTPVMLSEVMQFLQPQSGQFYVDCTLGGGGYSFALAKKVLPNGKVIAIDADEIAIQNAQNNIKKQKINNIILVHENFVQLHNIIKENWPEKRSIGFAGIVFDLGLSSAQLQDENRGFSFQLDAPLDMCFGRGVENGNQETVEIINKYSEGEIAEILKEYGEEKHAKIIAKEVVQIRKNEKIKTTKQLVEIVCQAVPGGGKRSRINPATKTFQALRIATNQELKNLKDTLPQAIDLLVPGGRIAVVSYHSLEDRIVKRFFKLEARECICSPQAPTCQCDHEARLKIITKKIITPTEDEIKKNPRARSGKLRIAERL